MKQKILNFCGFTTLRFLYLMLLYVGDYGVLILTFSLAYLFQLTATQFTVSNFWSVDTILGVVSIYEFILVDLFNIFLSLPGNLLCFIPQFKSCMIQVFVKDWYGKSHIFHLNQTATISALRKQISVKFKIPQNVYWLSGPERNLTKNNEKLVNLTTFQMRVRLFGGNDECCIKGCPEIASNRKVNCLTGVYELKLSPDMLSQANDLNVNICHHHYNLQRKRGHKPKRLHSSILYATPRIAKTDDKSENDDMFSLLGVKTCTSCKKHIVVTKTTPCPQHILTCLDEKNDGKVEETNCNL